MTFDLLQYIASMPTWELTLVERFPNVTIFPFTKAAQKLSKHTKYEFTKHNSRIVIHPCDNYKEMSYNGSLSDVLCYPKISFL